MSEQKDLFGEIQPAKVVKVKKPVDKRLTDFYRIFGRHITPYVVFILSEKVDSPPIPENHPFLSVTEGEKRIVAMCNIYGMQRTICDEGLVASGNGKFLYMVSVGGDSTTRKKE